jgi:hypothetical protein
MDKSRGILQNNILPQIEQNALVKKKHDSYVPQQSKNMSFFEKNDEIKILKDTPSEYQDVHQLYILERFIHNDFKPDEILSDDDKELLTKFRAFSEKEIQHEVSRLEKSCSKRLKQKIL